MLLHFFNNLMDFLSKGGLNFMVKGLNHIYPKDLFWLYYALTLVSVVGISYFSLQYINRHYAKYIST